MERGEQKDGAQGKWERGRGEIRRGMGAGGWVHQRVRCTGIGSTEVNEFGGMFNLRVNKLSGILKFLGILLLLPHVCT
jgi:hypothetical protein